MASPKDQRHSGLQASVITFSIRFHGVIIALACAVLAFGLVSLRSAKYDVFPEFAPPQVSIQTEAPGLTPEQVEMLVTAPIETQINGVPGIQKVVSTSIQGLSIINVYFAAASNIYLDRQVVAERLSVAAQQLPQGVKAPAMTPLTSSTGILLVAGLTSTSRSLMDLKTIAQWTLRPRLLAVPGVSKVTVFGKDTRSLQIQVRPEQLIRFRLGMNEIVEAAQKATGVRGAGFIDTANQRILFESEGQSLTPDQLARTVLVSEGAGRVTLGDVAHVVEAPEPPVGGATIDGIPAVVMNVEAQYGANTAEVTPAVEAALADLAPSLKAQGIKLHANLFRPASFIDAATGNILESLYMGGILVVIVLILFLFDVRAAAIALSAIPLSLLTALIVLEKLGATINTMTLGGLAIAVGVVVDDAVIDLENIVRRLRENQKQAHPRPAAQVIHDAAFEVRGPVVYATFAVLLVFVPILLLPGISGALFAPLGMSYCIAVLASLVVALTLVPALSMSLLASRKASREPPAVRWCRARYDAILLSVCRRPGAVIMMAAAFTILACATLPLFSARFLPELNEGHFVVHMSAVPGTSLERSLETGAHVAAALRKIPAVRSVAQRLGRAELAEDTWGTHYSEFEVDLQPGSSGEEQEEARAQIRQALAGFVGVKFAIKTFLTERIEETLSGYSAEIAVNIIGNNLDVLDEKAQEIARLLNAAPGVTEVMVQSPPGLPQLTIKLRKEALVRWGLQPTDVLDFLRTAYAGYTSGQTYEGSQIFNVIVILHAKDRSNISSVGKLALRVPDGTLVPLEQLADIYEASGRYQIMHKSGLRMASVSFNIAGGSTASAVQAVRRRIESQIKLPPGAYLQFAGSVQAQNQAEANLILNSTMAGVAVVLLLSIITGGWRNLLLILVNLPFALVGGVLAVFGTGGILTLGSMVGFVTVFGITVRNSILIISHYEHLVEVEQMSWGLTTAIKGASDRLTAILVTSLVTGLGLLPLAIGGGSAGQEIEGPMAIVILGGLFTSMVLNLLVLPALALRYGSFKRIDHTPKYLS